MIFNKEYERGFFLILVLWGNFSYGERDGRIDGFGGFFWG